MKHKSVILITFFSLAACIIHAVILNTVNEYLFASALKLTVFTLFPIVCYCAFLRYKPVELAKLFYKKGEQKNLKFSFILGFIVFAFLAIMFVILRPHFDQQMIVSGLAGSNITEKNFPFVFIYVILINAAMEEFFFRGFVFLILFNFGYKRTAYIYSSLLFSVYHVFIMNSLFSPAIFALLLFGLVVAGLIFNELARRCKSISGSLIVHVSANLAINLIGAYYFYMN